MKCYTLTHLLRPCDPGSFFRDVWGRVARCYPGSLREEGGAILSLEAFEWMLGTLNRAHEGWLHFARGGLKQIPQDMVDPDGMLDLRKIKAAFAGGETLYLTKAERVSSPLMSLCRAVELDLVARGVRLRKSVNAHVFLTPPGSQGFPAHRDEHASFVLQVEGSKEWTVYELEGGPRGALRPGGVEPSSLRQAKAHAYRLVMGDVLYVPEWWPHEARASDAHSLHVTLRVFPLRWVDVVTELCADHPTLSGAMPRDTAVNPSGLLQRLIGVLGSQEFRQPLPGLLEDVLRRHAVPRTALPGDSIRQALSVEQVELDTPLARTQGAVCMVFAAGDEVCIGFPGGVIRGPAVMRRVFEHVAQVDALRPCELPPIAGLNYDRLDVARALVREGLLRVAGCEEIQ